MDTSYKHMHSVVSIRFAAALAFVFSASLLAQTPPATTTTKTTKTKARAKPAAVAPQIPPPLPPTQPPIPLTPSQLPPHRALITYASDALSVSADNSSLNQILREISHETGITISGGVADERVFGQYGPGTPAQVLASLLDGTGSNMLLLHSDGNTPAQLILTSRQGGPTPPNPNAALLEERSAPEITPPAPQVEPAPARHEPNRSSGNPPNASGANGTPPSSDPSQPDSPNGVKTPQQIYDQLQRLRQQQPQTPQ
jgi:hypothetical protein